MNRIILLFSLIFSISCSNSHEPEKKPSENISFQTPQIGQISSYQKAVGDGYKDKTTNEYNLLNTFLDVEITAIINDTLFINESITDSTELNYAVLITTDSLIIFKPNSMFLYSHLFGNHFQNYRIPLQTNSSNKIEILGWKTSTTFCECYITGYTIDFTPFNTVYNSLNVVVDEVEMGVDKFGYNFAFSEKDGIVLSTKILSWQNINEIWLLTDKE